MWAWIYYTCITFGALAVCSTISIVQIMGSENFTESNEEDLNKKRATVNSNSADIEAGIDRGDMHHRKSGKSSGLYF